jgi:hypothetical protein
VPPTVRSVQALALAAGNRATSAALAGPAVQRACACGGTCGSCQGGVHEDEAAAAVPRVPGPAPVVQRAKVIVDARHLASPLLAGDTRLDKAFHNNPPLTASDTRPIVAKMQEGLDTVVGPMKRSRRTGSGGAVTWDGVWGGETSSWVRKLQSANGIRPGGWEAGRATLDALDQALLSRKPVPPKPIPPKPVPPPPAAAKVCGPDVTAEVKRVWSAIQKDYNGWSFGTRLNACRMLIQPIIVRDGKPALNQDAFDTRGLYQGDMAWAHAAPYAGVCGVPAPAPYDPSNPFDPAYEDCRTLPAGSGCCSNSVQIGSGCWLSGTPNYGTFGIMMRLCYDDAAIGLAMSALHLDRETTFGLAPTLALAAGYKVLKHDNWSDPAKWSGATWLGGPGADPGGGNRSDCAGTCPHPGPSGTFDYIWETAHGTHGG